jgi:hypothetical protein
MDDNDDDDDDNNNNTKHLDFTETSLQSVCQYLPEEQP